MYDSFSVQFKSGNKATLNLPSASGDKEERNCDYEIKGKEIYLAAEGETVKAFEIKGDSLIVYGITNLDGSIVLKKNNFCYFYGYPLCYRLKEEICYV